MVPLFGGLPTGSLQNPAWSPDGGKLAFTRFRNGYNKAPADIFVTEPATGRLTTVTDDGSENVSEPGAAWHPTGGLLFASDRGGHDEIYAWKDGQLTQLTSRSGFVAWEPSWSPSGEAIVFESHPDQAGDNDTPGQIISHRIGTESYTALTTLGRDCRQPNWSPDGRLIVYQEKLAAGTYQLELYDVASGTSRALVAGTDATFSPDSSRVLYSDADDKASVIPIGGGLAQRLGGSGYQGAPSWSPDGRTVAYETSANDPDNSTTGTTLALIDVSGTVSLPQVQVIDASISGKPLRYLIGADAAPAIAGCCVEAPYGVTPPPGGIHYCNLFDETKTDAYGPYVADTDVSRQYGERVVDPSGDGWARLIESQLARVPTGGTVEWDNIDGYPIAAVLDCYDRTAARSIAIIAKNPGNLGNGDKLKVVAHPAVVGIIVEQGAGSPDEMQALRIAAGKPALPVRFVAFGSGRAWADAMAQSIRAKSYPEMGVTYDSAGEYGGVIMDILVPTATGVPPVQPVTQPAQPVLVTSDLIVAKLRECVGKFHDGPDIPNMAREVGQLFPELASYCNEATNAMPWCADFQGWFWAHYFRIAPPPVKDGVGFFWVDRWKDWGTPVAPAQKQPGDTCMWFGNPHHISSYVGNGKYIGGNQSDAVTAASFREPDAVRRAPGLGNAATPLTINASDPSAYPLLSNGDTGAYVSRLQTLLGITVDGEFGDDTEQAVRAFQAAHPQLSVDGEVGPQTWAALLGKPVPLASDPKLYLDYRAGYAADWRRMMIEAGKLATLDTIAGKLMANKTRYQAVSARTGVPWFMIAALHERESSANFATQLAQGDPLDHKSTHVPAGRGPFATWEDGAYDALVTLKALNTVSDWTIERMAYDGERYNGWGYRSRGVPSAYLWSFSNIYLGGKYVADGVWSATARDAQCGILPLIKRMAALDASIVLRSFQDAPQPGPVVQPVHTDPLPADSTLAGVLAAFAAVNARLDQMETAIQALKDAIMPAATPPTAPSPTSSTGSPIDLSQALGHLTQLTTVLQQIMPAITQVLGTIQKNPLPALPGLAGPVGGAVVPATLTGLLGGAFKLLGSSGGIGSIVALGVGLMLAMQQGVIGTPLPTASGGTPTGQGLSTLLGGGGLLSLISWVGQLIKPHPASTPTS